MTAFAIIKKSDSIHVVTDGLVTGGLGIVSKAFTIPHLNAVVVSRGVQTVARGDIPSIRMGKRILVLTAPLCRKLGIEQRVAA